MVDSLTFILEDSKIGMKGTVITYPKFEIHCYMPSQVVIGRHAQHNSSEVNSNTMQNTMSADSEWLKLEFELLPSIKFPGSI